jgi:hypothetical protein
MNIHAALRTLVALAYVLRQSPRPIVRLLPAWATRRCTWCQLQSCAAGSLSCKPCGDARLAKIRAESGRGKRAPQRRERESEAWRGGLRAGVAAALKLEEE